MENQEYRSYPSIAQSWGIVGIAIVAQLVLAPVYVGTISSLGKDLAMLFYYVLTIGGAFAFAHYIRKKETGIANYPIAVDSVKIILLSAVFTIALGFGVTDPIASLIPMPDYVKQAFSDMMGGKGIFAFLTIAIAAPILEELIFRGVILDGLLKKYSPKKAIFISSFLFAFLHLNPWQFIGAMAIGSFAGYIYYKSNNLLLAIIIHFVNNGFAFLMSLSVDLKEEMGKTVVESYGGIINAILIITGSIVVALLCLFLINKEFKKKEE